MTSDVQEARAQHNFENHRVRPEEVVTVDLACLECGHIWHGVAEDGEPENCIREDCGSSQVARA